jgi:hypothetical protein
VGYPYKTVSLAVTWNNPPFTIHDCRRLVHDSRQDVDILVDPSIFPILAMITRMVELGYMASANGVLNRCAEISFTYG